MRRSGSRQVWGSFVGRCLREIFRQEMPNSVFGFLSPNNSLSYLTVPLWALMGK
jgi:hypothetical protein